MKQTVVNILKATLSDGQDYIIEYTQVWNTEEYGDDIDGNRGVELTECLDETIKVITPSGIVVNTTLSKALMHEIMLLVDTDSDNLNASTEGDSYEL